MDICRMASAPPWAMGAAMDWVPDKGVNIALMLAAEMP